MDTETILKKVGGTSIEQARRLGVSDGHIADLKSGRRALSLPLAAKLEKLTGEQGIVDAVVADKTSRPQSGLLRP